MVTPVGHIDDERVGLSHRGSSWVTRWSLEQSAAARLVQHGLHGEHREADAAWRCQTRVAGDPVALGEGAHYGERVPLSDWAKDNFVAPELSKFTAADLPDMSETDAEQEHWLANFILNNLLGPQRYVTPLRQQMYNFLRRSHAAFRNYSAAREATLAYLAAPDSSLPYITAINHWEWFLADAWQAYAFFAHRSRKVFDKGDGGPRERLYNLYCRSRHAEEAIERGDFVEDSPLCVWLANDGLRSTDDELAFGEVIDILRDLARLASAVQNPDTVGASLSAYVAEFNDNTATARSIVVAEVTQ